MKNEAEYPHLEKHENFLYLRKSWYRLSKLYFKLYLDLFKDLIIKAISKITLFKNIFK